MVAFGIYFKCRPNLYDNQKVTNKKTPELEALSTVEQSEPPIQSVELKDYHSDRKLI